MKIDPKPELDIHARDHVRLLRIFNEELSPKEREVVQRLLDGRSTQEIAIEFNRSLKTIETQRATALRKFEETNITALMRDLFPSVSKTMNGLRGGDIFNLNALATLEGIELRFVLEAGKRMTQKYDADLDFCELAKILEVPVEEVEKIEQTLLDKLGASNSRELCALCYTKWAVSSAQFKTGLEETPSEPDHTQQQQDIVDQPQNLISTFTVLNDWSERQKRIAEELHFGSGKVPHIARDLGVSKETIRWNLRQMKKSAGLEDRNDLKALIDYAGPTPETRIS